MRHVVQKCKGPGETAAHMAAAGNTLAAFASMATSTSAGFPDLSLSLPPLSTYSSSLGRHLNAAICLCLTAVSLSLSLAGTLSLSLPF